ncbi:MAG: phosphoribosylformylglycinamidine cyclo-ligase [Pyrinomonadaceae bacterium]|nr:phosphoribosylformylglycinamidine cyclo-ligase [Phycisphaerales bacterium]
MSQVRRSSPPPAHTSQASSRGSDSPVTGPGLTYASSGVNLSEKDEFTDSLVSLMRRTHGPRVIQNPGGFAGLFRLDYNEKIFARNYKDPVLVACADGCGTKVKIAAAQRKYDTIGIDLVAMNVNDMIVQGAEPLFFLDYVAVGKVDKRMLTDLLKGIAEGCRRAGCALLGGETAEMPGIYAGDDFDLAGFAVGVVELARAVDSMRVEPGDVVLGLASDGIHSNGYSLVRKVVQHAGLDLYGTYPALFDGAASAGAALVAAETGDSGSSPKTKPPASKSRRGSTTKAGGTPADLHLQPTLGDVLLTPTRIYVQPVVKLLHSYRVKRVVSGMAHITGSGLAGNLERALHPKVDALIDVKSWDPPAIFKFLQHHGKVSDEEMRRVFNMGIGYCLIVRPTFADSVKEQLERSGERVSIIGKIAKGKGKVIER